MKPLKIQVALAGILVLLAGLSNAWAIGRAVMGTPPPQPAASWAGPIAKAFQEYGPARVAGIGLQSLTYFSAVGLDFKTRIEADPGAAVPLIKFLEANGVDLEAFSHLTSEERMTALQKAAQAAEEEANQTTDILLQRAGNIAASDYAAADRFVHPAADLWGSELPYIREDLRSKLQLLRARIDEVHQRRQKLQDAFVRDLPKKIAAWAFTAGNTYEKTNGRWLIADYSPVESFGSLREAFSARIRELDHPVAGPWSEEILGTMEGALLDPAVQKELDREGGAAEMAALQRMVAGAQENLRPRLAISDAKLSRALRAMQKYLVTERAAVPSPAHIRKIYEHYDNNYFGSVAFPLRMRIAHALSLGRTADGGKGFRSYPAWSELENMKTLAERRSHKNALRSLAAMAGTAILGLMLQSGWLHAAAFIAAFLSAIIFYFFIRQRDSFQFFPGGNARRWMADYFDRLKNQRLDG